MAESARAEWDPLREVMIHRPGIEMFFGLTEPYSFLYERAFGLTGAVQEHESLERALTAAGVTVRRLEHFAADLAVRRPEILDGVRAAAGRLVRYSGPRTLVEEARRSLRRNIERFDAETLFDLLLLRPSVHLRRGRGERVIFPTVALDTPLANLCFLRDQQALTAGGFVLGRLAKPQRRHEAELTSAVLRMGRARIAGRIVAPGTFEGGDFLPMGEFALLGTGDRTNRAAVRQLLRMPIGVDEVAVVRQPSHPALPDGDPDPMINMHLDTYVNVPGRGLVVGCEPLLRRARVEVYARGGGGGMHRLPGSHSLPDYLKAKRFEVLPITTLEQMCYASNFLCLADRRILAVEVERELDRVLAGLALAARRRPRRYAALLALARREREELTDGDGFFPHKRSVREAGIDVTPLTLRELTGGYGGAHCLTCVLDRSPRRSSS